jgi:hypothetical protein
VFKIEDETHAEAQAGEVPSFEHALAEVGCHAAGSDEQGQAS